MNDKSKLKYSCYLPDNYEMKDSLPLIIALHWGWGQDNIPKYFSKIFMEEFILPIFKDQKSIIVAPDCPGNSWIENISTNSVLELRNYCIDEYNIDTSKILITGFSLGGIGTWYYAAHYSNLYSYAMPIAGYPKEEWLDHINNIHLSIINSIDDVVIPFEQANTAAEYLIKKGLDVNYKKLYGVSHYNTKLFINPAKSFLPDIFD
ncbi:MAG: alpha/beta hydrolase-fold protein [Bacteroidales bacterium]|jgi:predicted peptidase|nr:alpha/beta hydrolase-fold protein [Bacteroidales bacterium]